MTYQQILDRLLEIERAILGAGQVIGNTRLGRYKRALAKLADPSVLSDLPRHFRDAEMLQLFFTMGEVFELRTIFETLNPQHAAVLIPRLRDLLSGPMNAVDETSHNSSSQARNVQFELFLMAQLVEAGFPLIDGTLTDVRTSHAGREILIECKRPQRSTGVRAAVRSAVDQLVKQPRNQSAEAVKIVAISLSKVLSEGTQLLRVYDEIAARRVVTDAIEHEIGLVLSYFHGRAGADVAGILAYASASVIRLSEAAPANVMMQVFFDNPQVPPGIARAAEDWFAAYKAPERPFVDRL